MGPIKYTILISFLIAAAGKCTNSAKILMLPVRQKSHVLEMISLASPLMNHGHEVTMVLPETVDARIYAKKSSVEFLQWKYTKENQGKGIEDLDDVIKKFFDGTDEWFLKKLLREVPEGMVKSRGECHGLLDDHALDKKLREKKFDLVIVDGLFPSRCMFLVPFRMGVPYVGFGAIVPSDIMSTTFVLSSITPASVLSYGSRLTFFQRILSLIASHLPNLLIDNFGATTSEFKKYADGRPFNSMAQLVSESKIWMVNQHPLLEFPQPNAPFVVSIGGLNAAPPKPLPDKLSKFADKSKDGMIVISFGSTVKHLPDNIYKSLITAARKFPNFNFLMRNNADGDVPPPSPNVMMVDWLPQNDVLGHPKTKLFVTHCGSGGQHEALYHGVPMLGVPGFADQFHNAARIVQRGYGLRMSLADFTTKELLENLQALLYTDTYKNNIKHAARIVHDPLNKPNETALYWIDHVIKYGGDHLKIQSDLNGFQILMWDICLFFLLLTLFVIWIDIKIMQFIFRKCCQKRPKSKPKKKTS